MIYLDYAANTPADKRVLECFVHTEASFPANANSTHPFGKAARERLDSITAALTDTLGVSAEEIIYTSGASEANNLAIKGIAHSYRAFGKHIISTCLEHPSVSGSLTYLQEQGYEIDLADINPQGQVDLIHLKELLRKDTILVTICSVDSELGTLQPIREIAEMLREYPNCRLHTDATQAVGKMPVDFSVGDCITFAPHKFYGLNGSGVLIKKKSTAVTPLIHGGAGDAVFRSGTPCLGQIAALEKALSLSLAEMPPRLNTVTELNRHLRQKLSAYPLVRINSPEKSSPFILNLSVKGVKAKDFKRLLEENGVCISIKSACSTESTPSRAVYTISGDKKNALSSWRISLSHLTQHSEIEAFLGIFDACYKILTKT